MGGRAEGLTCADLGARTPTTVRNMFRQNIVPFFDFYACGISADTRNLQCINIYHKTEQNRHLMSAMNLSNVTIQRFIDSKVFSQDLHSTYVFPNSK